MAATLKTTARKMADTGRALLAAVIFTGRLTLCASLALPLSGVLPTSAFAQTTQRMDPADAQVFVQTLADNALQTLQIQTISADERESEFRTLLESGFQLEFIGLLVLGNFRRSATIEEIAEYQEYFSEYILRKYSILLGSYAGEEFVVTKSLPAGKRDILVKAEIRSALGSNILTDWRVRLFRGEPKIIDIKVEGISMVQSQREEFSSILRRNGMSGLIELLRQENTDLAVEAPA